MLRCVAMMRFSLVIATGVLIACGQSLGAPAGGDNAPDGDWKWVGTPVALLGRPVNVEFYRQGTPPKPAPTVMRVAARCVSCSPAQHLDLELTSVSLSQLPPGAAEGIAARVTLPAEGRWIFEPLGGELTVRSPTSDAPPVVALAEGAGALATGCGLTEVAATVATLARALNEVDSTALGRALREQTDFSVTGEPLAKFAATTRSDVLAYARSRNTAGDRLYPYFVQAAPSTDGFVDMGIYLVRQASDLPSASGYRRVFVGSRLACSDLRLMRFNAQLMSD